MNKHPVFTLELTTADPCFTTIRVHKQGHGVTEFRGDGIQQWGLAGAGVFGPQNTHIRGGKSGPLNALCWAEWLHNGLIGPHATIFHAGTDPFVIHGDHEDYAFMSALWDLAQLTDRKVLELVPDTLFLPDLI
jgi:hypothetical protein